MTIGHLIEILAGKGAALEGEQVDGTPFVQSTDPANEDRHDAVVHRFGEVLKKYGFDERGDEVMVDGRTGKVMRMKVFMGPTAIQTQKHMVEDKYHARSRGPRNPQTRQAVEGRHRDGGLRFGEMERDAAIAHGAMGFLMDRLLHCSDASIGWVCQRCGELAQPPKRRAGHRVYAASVHAAKPFCHACLRHDTVVPIELPASCMLAMREMNGLHVANTFVFKDPPGATAATDDIGGTIDEIAKAAMPLTQVH